LSSHAPGRDGAAFGKEIRRCVNSREAESIAKGAKAPGSTISITTDIAMRVWGE